METHLEVYLRIQSIPSSAPSGGTAVQQFEALFAEYQALFAQWEKDKISGVDMTKINAQLEACMTQIVQFIGNPENFQELEKALEAKGWQPNASYPFQMNPFALLVALQTLPRYFLEGHMECSLILFNECVTTIDADLSTSPQPEAKGLEDSLPQTAMKILIEQDYG